MADDIAPGRMDPYAGIVDAVRIGHQDESIADLEARKRCGPGGEHRSVDGCLERIGVWQNQ